VEKGARGMGGDFAKSRKEIGVAPQPISIYMPFSSQVGMNCYIFFIPSLHAINLCSQNINFEDSKFGMFINRGDTALWHGVNGD
jgi:hypothetical protein